MTVTFFGHRSVEKEIKLKLERVLTDLIEDKNADLFYVGNQGDFDSMVRECLKILGKIYPHINYSVVLARMPDESDEYDYRDFLDANYPDELEKTPPKYAIDKRNRWMINKADCVVTYVKHLGGAYKYKELAEKKGKLIINLADQD